MMNAAQRATLQYLVSLRIPLLDRGMPFCSKMLVATRAALDIQSVWLGCRLSRPTEGMHCARSG